MRHIDNNSFTNPPRNKRIHAHNSNSQDNTHTVLDYNNKSRNHHTFKRYLRVTIRAGIFFSFLNHYVAAISATTYHYFLHPYIVNLYVHIQPQPSLLLILYGNLGFQNAYMRVSSRPHYKEDFLSEKNLV